MSDPRHTSRDAPADDSFSEDEAATPSFDSNKFRQVLGQYPTGVAVVTAMSAESAPLGMTVGSFGSVSLDPPLVAFMPDRNSSSWKAIRESGPLFCVNVLGSDQEDVCRRIAVKNKVNKFEDIAWRRSPAGLPVIAGAVAYIDCRVETIHDAGDHHIVLGQVTGLDLEQPRSPLLFFRGGYGSFAPLSITAADDGLVDQLAIVDRARPYMESLASRLSTEVTALASVGDQITYVAASGQSETTVAPTRVGQRMPFVPPVGASLVAWNSARLEEWLGRLGDDPDPGVVQELRDAITLVRRRGYSLMLGHEANSRFEAMAFGSMSSRKDADMRQAVRSLSASFNPPRLDEEARYEFHSCSAPVFDANREVAFALTLWGPLRSLFWWEIQQQANELLEATGAATRAIGGIAPDAP